VPRGELVLPPRFGFNTLTRSVARWRRVPCNETQAAQVSSLSSGWSVSFREHRDAIRRSLRCGVRIVYAHFKAHGVASAGGNRDRAINGITNDEGRSVE